MKYRITFQLRENESPVIKLPASTTLSTLQRKTPDSKILNETLPFSVYNKKLLALVEKKNTFIETDPQIVLILQLADKYFIINM